MDNNHDPFYSKFQVKSAKLAGLIRRLPVFSTKSAIYPMQKALYSPLLHNKKSLVTVQP